MSDTDVELAVRWTEAGQNIPDKTVAGLQKIKGAAGEAAPAIGDRMSQAFARLEAREPTMVLRRARMAIEEMAMSAVGATGPLGRLGATMALMGGPTTLGLVAGFAAVGLEVKSLLEFNDKLDKQLVGLNTKFATLGGSISVALRQMEAMRQTDVEQPSWVIRLLARIGEPLPGMESDLGTAVETGFAAQMATQANTRALMDRQLDRQREERNQQATARLLHHITAGPTPQALQALIGQRDNLIHLGAESGKMWAKAFLDTVRQEDPQKQLRDLLAQHGTFERLGGEALQDWNKGWLAASAGAAPGLTPRTPLHLAPRSRQFQQELPQLQTFALGGGLGEAVLGAHADLSLNAPAFGRSHPIGTMPRHPIEGSERNEARIDQQNERNAERMATVIGREIGPIIALMAGGGARGAVAGLAGISGTLASLNDPRTGKALLGAAAPELSLASGVLSGLTSLLGGGGQKPKFIIASYEAEALRQMKDVRGEPLTTQVIVVGAVDMRQVQQALSRLNRIGIIPRLP